MNPISSNGILDDLPYPDFVNDGDAQIRYDTYASYPPQLFKSQIGISKNQKSDKKKTHPVTMLNRISESVWKLNTKVCFVFFVFFSSTLLYFFFKLS